MSFCLRQFTDLSYTAPPLFLAREGWHAFLALNEDAKRDANSRCSPLLSPGKLPPVWKSLLWESPDGREWRNLADAQDSGSCVRKDVRVQVPPRALFCIL